MERVGRLDHDRCDVTRGRSDHEEHETPRKDREKGTLFGANVVPGGVNFRIWAPKARRVDVEIVGKKRATFWRLASVEDGVHAGTVPELRAGARYRFRLDGGASYPDPWSRSQPAGVHGPSEVVDLASFRWTDDDWRGIEGARLVLYEVHVGAYSPEGTFDALARQLTEIHRLGVTAIELMPVAEFPGRWNWGYDGAYPYAPSRSYGGVGGLQRLVDRAHRLGLAVILDVVYNHLGPAGNYLRAFSDDYFTDRHATPWGDAINYDAPNSRHVRELAIQNACYWLCAFHLDGLRLDAVQAIVDDGPTPLLAELAWATRESVGPDREIHLIAEDNRNDVRLVQPIADGGVGLDAVWADDFHHALHTFLTGERAGYYVDYGGSAEDIATTLSTGFLYQGQPSRFRGSPRGTQVTNEPASAFVFCLQNHDQIGNRAFGERLHQLIDLDTYAVASTLLLLAPETPLLFMGQEFAASSPFLYFTDHEERLGRLITEGRRKEFATSSGFADPAARQRIPDPQAQETFIRSKLDLGERQRNAGIYTLYRELLRLRRDDPVFSRPDRARTEAACLGDRCIVVRRWSASHERLVIANFGTEIRLDQVRGLALQWLTEGNWKLELSTRDSRFGGERPSARATAEPADVVPGALNGPAVSAVVLSRTRGGPVGV